MMLIYGLFCLTLTAFISLYSVPSEAVSSDIFHLVKDSGFQRSNLDTQKAPLSNEFTDELVKTIINNKFFEESQLRDSLKLLQNEIKEFEASQLKKAGYSETLEAQASSDGPSLFDKGLKFLKGILGDDSGDNQDSSDTDTSEPSTDDQTVIHDIEKYLHHMVDGKNGTLENVLRYVVNYVHKNVHFWLFTKRQTGFEDLTIGRQANISESDFKKWKRTVILIHGWINAGDNYYAESMIKAYDAYGDFNIISVDWSELSYSFYTLSRIAVNFVGPYVAKMIDFLAIHHDVKPRDIHILGHSLGAHIAGIAGMFVKHGKVGRITGFDPASPLFGNDQKYRLDASDGKFVDVIHTSILGMSDSLGHVDFYPNGGGPSQPGCGLNIVCSHRRSYQYYIASMTDNNFLAFPCNSWDEFLANNCTTNDVYMGLHTSNKASGTYYLRTAGVSPYALGIKTLVPTENPTPLPVVNTPSRKPLRRRHPKPKPHHNKPWHYDLS